MTETTDTSTAELEAATRPAPDLPAPDLPTSLTPASVPPELEDEPIEPELADAPDLTPRKGRSKLFYVLAGVFGTVAVIALLCGGLSATAIFFAYQATSEVQPVLTEFMQNLADEDVDAAYAMMSEAGKKQISHAELADFVTGPGRQYIQSFESLTVQNLNRRVVANSNPDTVQGDVATVQAILQYKDGSEGILNATLQKIGGRRLIFGAHIQHSPVPEQLEKPTTG